MNYDDKGFVIYTNKVFFTLCSIFYIRVHNIYFNMLLDCVCPYRPSPLLPM